MAALASARCAGVLGAPLHAASEQRTNAAQGASTARTRDMRNLADLTRGSENSRTYVARLINDASAI